MKKYLDREKLREFALKLHSKQSSLFARKSELSASNERISTNENAINVLDSRMDEFTRLTDGSTSGDAELADIRIGHDGTEYDTAGDAVREQVSDLKEEAVSIREPLTADDDADSLTYAGMYLKENHIEIGHGVNSNRARIIVFRSNAGGYGITQLWFDTYNNQTWYRTKNQAVDPWNEWKQIIDSNAFVFSCKADTEFGNIDGITPGSGAGYLSNGGLAMNGSRTKMLYEINPSDYGYGDTWIGISMPDEQYQNIDQLILYFYAEDGELLLRRSYIKTPTLEFTNPRLTYISDPSVKYLKIVTYKNTSEIHLESLTITSNKPVIERYNLNINNATIGGDTLAFTYMIDDKDKRTSGRLLLPQNYSVDGKKVPLIVYAHGSGSIMTWGTQMANSARKRELFQYLADEGFAVFDCYPWTNEYQFNDDDDKNVYSPYKFPVIIQSYLQGIKYVTSRFNIDPDQVSLICKSQGGHIGHWAAVQNVFPFKCICMQAPDITTGRGNAFYNKNARSGFVYWMDVEGTDTEIEDFVDIGNLRDPDVKSFLEKNKETFVAIQPFAQGVTNSDEDTLFNDFMGYDVTSIPQWMQDLGFPATVPYENCTVPAFATHKDYVKNSFVPIKFWCAYDDEAVSSYGNYAIYQWLKNGGSYVKWREMPVGTGGHMSMDTSEDAVLTSGTTALGIPYTDIPVAFVEAVDFINKCIG